MTEILPVLIVGSGPAGLVSALLLAQNGIKARIIDKDDKFHVGNRGFGIQPRTFELFKLLGILDDVQKLATPIITMRAYKLPGGTEPARTWDLYDVYDPLPDRPYPNGGCLGQHLLEEILRNHLAKLGVFVELNKGLVAIEQSPDSVVATIALHVNGQPTDERETVNATYLIGADGARGPTRKLLGLTFQGETRDSDGQVWADVEIKGLSTDYWHTWGTPGQYTIMARPFSSDGNEFGVGVLGQNFDPKDLAEPEKLKAFFAAETGRTDLEFGRFKWITYFRPNIRMVNNFQQGRAFVVGDAAHVHPPTGGQGMNLSVQDASNLAWKLALTLKGLASDSLLSTYNAERTPIIAHMLRATSALLTHTTSEAKDSTAAPQDATKSGWLRWRNSALYLFGINYRFSEIVVEERGITPPEDLLARSYAGYDEFGTLCAGDRMPDASGLVKKDGTTTTLLDIIRPDIHTVLVFGSSDADKVIEATKRVPAGVVQNFIISNSPPGESVVDVSVLFDKEGHARDAYRVDGSLPLTVCIIRPDGFIGAIVPDAEGVIRYFSKIFK